VFLAGIVFTAFMFVWIAVEGTMRDRDAAKLAKEKDSTMSHPVKPVHAYTDADWTCVIVKANRRRPGRYTTFRSVYIYTHTHR
jgi:hypothetical protein